MKKTSYRIEVSARGAERRRQAMIVKAVRAALDFGKCRTAVLCVAIVDDDTIAELHERYMAIPGATDVITFDLADRKIRGLADGQIVVSADTARREARQRKLPFEQELLRYVIHGTLHLLGYDDVTPAKARRMHQAEDEVLDRLGRLQNAIRDAAGKPKKRKSKARRTT